MAEDRLAEVDDGLGVAVDGVADRALQLFFAAHSDASFRPSAVLCRLDLPVKPYDPKRPECRRLAIRWVDRLMV